MQGQMDKRQILFKAVEVGGREYVIYTDGSTEGFGGVALFNYYPTLLAQAVAKVKIQLENGTALASPLTTSEYNADLVGARHSTPA